MIEIHFTAKAPLPELREQNCNEDESAAQHLDRRKLFIQ
jgi:hypothetical protein